MIKRIFISIICLILLSVNCWAIEKEEAEKYMGLTVIVYVKTSSGLQAFVGRVIDIAKYSGGFKNSFYITLIRLNNCTIVLRKDIILSVKKINPVTLQIVE